MTPETAALIAAVIAAVASVVSLYVNSKLTVSRERRQQLWQYDLEQIRAVEQLGGRITELVGGYPSIQKLERMFPVLIAEFEDNLGRLRRYSEINQAMRDLHNAASRVVDSRMDSEDDRQDKKDLAAAFEELLRACDRTLKKNA